MTGWTTPHTFLVGDTLGASDLNTYLSNNDSYLLQRNYGYAPIQTSGADYTLTVATTWTVVDNSNLVFSLTPQSTRVKCEFSFTLDMSGGAGDISFDVQESVGSTRMGPAAAQGVMRLTLGGSETPLRPYHGFGIFTGLTANTAYTFKLVYYKHSGAANMKRSAYPIVFGAWEF